MQLGRVGLAQPQLTEGTMRRALLRRLHIPPYAALCLLLVVASPARAADTGYVAAVVGSAAGASKYHLGLFNAAGSTVRLVVDRVYVASHLAATNTGAATSFVLTRTTAAGAGAAGTIRLTDPAGRPLPSQVGALSAYTGGNNPTPASSGELAEAAWYTEEAGAQTTATPLWESDPAAPLVIPEGQGLAIQQTGLASAGAVSVFIHFHPETR